MEFCAIFRGGVPKATPPIPLLILMITHPPDLNFLSKFPYEARSEVQLLFSTRHLFAVNGWQSAWQNIASFCIELEDVAKRHGVPELFEVSLKHIGPGVGELKEMMRAFSYLQNPKYAQLVVGKISPQQICGVVDNFNNTQQKMDVEGLIPYAVITAVQDLSFDTIGTDDVLSVSPTTAGSMGEDTVKSVLDRLGIEYVEQFRNAYMCDFGEMKRPDFKVGAVKAKGDPRLSNGFYIESTTRLTEKNKDLGLFYLLHQVTQYSDLPTVVVYDGPAVSDRVWMWAQEFRKKHMKENRLFAVVTYQQFREWALRKLGSQL
jgi:hypothetical protein